MQVQINHDAYQVIKKVCEETGLKIYEALDFIIKSYKPKKK